MTRIKKIVTSNRLVEKLSALSLIKRILLLFCTAVLEGPVILFLMQREAKSPISVFIVFLGILAVGIAYLFWCVLLSFLSKEGARNPLANLLIILLPIALFCQLAWPVGPVRLTGDYELIRSQAAPSGECSAEAYLVEKNSDGTFSGEVYLVYTGYETGKRRVFQGENLWELDVAWENDDVLLINGERITVS